jgi:hypothetical protein
MKELKDKELIISRVRSKVLQLSQWKNVRWQGGRLYFESQSILNEIANYELDEKIFYLEGLYNQEFTIQDNWPQEAPDITVEFKDWILQTLTGLKLKRQKTKTLSKFIVRDRGKLFVKIVSNQWTITIVGGLILAFLAKLFGWV